MPHLTAYDRIPDRIPDRETFAAYVDALRADHRRHGHAWENATLDDFLEALAAWVRDAGGSYANAGQALPADGDWTFFARALMAAAYYE
ncbi:hypothetical protein ACIQNU_14820 [Streptomyces sp. NPDC091292]|uniref:DUF7660 family protein n=1 Tax=Streptomyces sp. NPDC091292 TaxID=3365991 RepID=UPI0038286701